MLSSIVEWVKEHKKLSIVAFIILNFTLLLVFVNVAKGGSDSQTANSESPIEDEFADSEISKEQAKYIERWGDPGDGFMWTDSGELQAVGSVDKTPEDVVYSYVRSLSTLDFATAQRFSYKTQVVKGYQEFFNQENDFNYTTSFVKNVYKQMLLSMKPNNITDVATFANFKQAVSMDIEIIDLTYKDFWLDDKLKLFEELRKYKVTERDTTKMKEFLYSYVLEYYASPKAKTRSVNVTLMLGQTYDGAWLVTNDADLDAIARYQDGEMVVNQIINEFERYIGELDVEGQGDEDPVNNDSSGDELLDSHNEGTEGDGVVDYSTKGLKYEDEE